MGKKGGRKGKTSRDGKGGEKWRKGEGVIKVHRITT
jgi:hypothetical protein